MISQDWSYTNWPQGRLIALSAVEGPTSYNDDLVARSGRDPYGIAVKLPGECFIGLPEGGEGEGGWVFSSDFFYCATNGQLVRGVLVDASHLLIEGDVELQLTDDKRLSVRQEGRRLLVGATSRFKPELLDTDIGALIAQRQEWLSQKQQLLSPQTREQAVGLFTALSIMKGQICSPEGLIGHRWSTPDRWPHRNMWLWDSTFHAMGWRHLDLPVAIDMLNAILGVQREDGFIPLSAWPTGYHKEYTQPPVLAFGVSGIFEMSGDKEWLASVYPKLEAYVKWDFANRDKDGGGLYEWAIEEHAFCRSGESGMDNSPRFDSALLLDAVDFNAFLALECDCLARFAKLLGNAEGAAYWQAQHERLARLINERLWCEDTPGGGFYCDLNPATGHHTHILSTAGFLPLLAGIVPPERVQILVNHLNNPETFGTAFPSPSISRANADVASTDMWRGPTWININWLIAKGLDRAGEATQARRIREVSRKEIERWAAVYATFFEYYDTEAVVPPPQLLRKGKCTPETGYHQSFHDYGWTACLYLDMAITLDKK